MRFFIAAGKAGGDPIERVARAAGELLTVHLTLIGGSHCAGYADRHSPLTT